MRLALSLRLCICWQGKDPLLHNSPDVRGRLSRGHTVNDLLKLSISKGFRRDNKLGVLGVSAAMASAGGDARNNGVPLGKPLGHGLVDDGLAQILGVGHGALDEAVHHAIFKTGEKLGSEAVSHKQLVVLSFAVAVDDQIGAVSVGAEQNGLLVHLVLGEAGLFVDCLEERVGDAIGEAHEFEVGVSALPVGADGENELAGGGFGVLARVSQRDVANVMLNGTVAV